MKKYLAFLLATALAFALCACEWEPLPEEEDKALPEAPIATEEAREEAPDEQTWLSFASIDELWASIDQLRQNAAKSMATAEEAAAEEPAAADTADAPMEAEAASAERNVDQGNGADYSTTNVQVAAVDEADIVKTDGKYIYILRQGQVSVVAARGADTELVGSFGVFTEEIADGYQSAAEMYLDGDLLYIICNMGDWSDPDRNGERTLVRCYDVSDPAAVQFKYELAQDGWYLSSRLYDGVLYLLSDYYVYRPVEEQPGTFMPRLYGKQGGVEMAIEDVAACPEFDNVDYTVVCAIDAAAGKRIAQKAVLGAGSTVYMNEKNLYLAGSRYSEEQAEETTESVYKVVAVDTAAYTDLTRFHIEDGGLELVACASVTGTLSDQFALDEYEGYLRLALTCSSDHYKIYTDEEFGFVNYVWEENSGKVDNRLCVLNDKLEPVGEVGGLAEDEWIRSVRFSGPIAYICTFKNIDPLFAIDLADPAAPKVLSALEIPGFSEYLHAWDDGLLLGLGQATNDDGTETDGVKLSMFDTADLADVREVDKYVIEDLWYSEALYNHKAALVDKNKDLICFPGENSYYIFGYDEKDGFSLKSRLELTEGEDGVWYFGNSRGLWSGDYFYICSDYGVAVLRLDDFSSVKELVFE